MNTEYRNKLYNRIKDVFEKEDTQERQGFLEARENFEDKQTTAFELARQVVERSYPNRRCSHTTTIQERSMATPVM